MTVPNVTVTPAAEKFMRRMVRLSGRAEGGFRLQVSPGGCSGLASTFSVEGAPEAGDTELSIGGLRLFVPAASGVLLDGATVDFADTPTQSGFVVHQADAATCGCSSSASPPASVAVPLAALRRR